MKKPVFLGYIIASDKEDFLLEYACKADFYQTAKWHLMPDVAKRFSTVKEACAVIDLMKFNYPVFVMEIYDIGKQVSLSSVDSMPVPDWL